MTWNRDRPGVAPQALEGIMRARVVSEHMGDNLAKIDQDPLTRGCAFETQWPLAHAREYFPDGLSDCACLSIGFSRPNDQIISN